MSFFRFILANVKWLAVGFMLMFLSSFGQTFFISVSSAEIRGQFGLSHGEWGSIYALGTATSAACMLFAGVLTDYIRVRVLGGLVLSGLGCACLFMALNPVAALLPVVIFALRFFGQGMSMHVAIVAMARWFVATRGRALAFALMGVSLGEATLPIAFVWLKQHFEWHQLWFVAGLLCFAFVPVLVMLLMQERTPQSDALDNSGLGMGDKNWTRKEAVTHPLFWSLVPAVMLMPMIGTAFWFHQQQFAASKGWDHLHFVTIIPLGTLALISSTIFFGWAIDRFGSGRLLPFFLLPAAAGFLLNAYAPTLAWSAVGVMLMGLTVGGQATLPNACWAEYYGTRHIGAIKAVVSSLGVLASAIGPAMTGWLIDFGVPLSHQLPFYAAMFCGASALMVIPLRKAAATLPQT